MFFFSSTLVIKLMTSNNNLLGWTTHGKNRILEFSTSFHLLILETLIDLIKVSLDRSVLTSNKTLRTRQVSPLS